MAEPLPVAPAATGEVVAPLDEAPRGRPRLPPSQRVWAGWHVLGLLVFFATLAGALVLVLPDREMVGRFYETDGRRALALGIYEREADANPRNYRIRLRQGSPHAWYE